MKSIALWDVQNYKRIALEKQVVVYCFSACKAIQTQKGSLGLKYEHWYINKALQGKENTSGKQMNREKNLFREVNQ